MWCRWVWAATASMFRWPEFNFSLPSSGFWLPEFNLSYFTSGWGSQSFRWLNVVFVDNLLWTIVTVVESFALIAMLCFFFTFCGCTL